MYKSNKVTRFVILSVKVSLKLWALVYIFSLNKQLVVDAKSTILTCTCSVQHSYQWQGLVIKCHCQCDIKKVTLLLQLALT